MKEAVAVDEYQARFGAVGRLFGRAGLDRLRAAHVLVVGIGGVGSWAVEALARSGVGRLTLVDLDDVCMSNSNRQLPAMAGEIGKPKVEVMGARVRGINPECEVRAQAEFFCAGSAAELLGGRFDYVVDAIDDLRNKLLLFYHARGGVIPPVVSGGAGGKQDPGKVQLADLGETAHDKLLQRVRKELRNQYGYPTGKRLKFGIAAVYSTEDPVYPKSDGTVCAQREPGVELGRGCEGGYGTASFVTGTFGLVAAGFVVRQLAMGGESR